MKKIVECVPNFSEGKNLAKIKKIFHAAQKIKSVKVFELEHNKDHNRCLFTVVGAPDDVLASVYESIKTAVKLIDMNKHRGEHPRIGAVDVVPFVPLVNVSMEDCVLLARKLGRKVGQELKIPVFLYEEAATGPGNKNLADIRKGEYESLKKKMKTPDYGPGKTHPTAGATVIGARKHLIAYNVNLDTADIGAARKIANKIREKNKGLAGVRALGFKVRGKAQVSMNLVDFKKTNFDEAYRAIEKEAKKLKVKIKNSEIYGMIPLEAMVLAVRASFKADGFKLDQILETRLYE